ncbi:MAG: hypothetical protein K2X94_05270 [Amoebophilaceae bacterium]|nr:hypothetical protein [Amoebophilaceae bacterium]MBY0244583.1 hypothetical protein [Sphingobacteriaceae bacterium]
MNSNNNEYTYYTSDLLAEYPAQKAMQLTISQCQDIIKNDMSENIKQELLDNFRDVALNNAPEEILKDLEIELNSENSNLIQNYLHELRNQVFFKCNEVGKI